MLFGLVYSEFDVQMIDKKLILFLELFVSFSDPFQPPRQGGGTAATDQSWSCWRIFPISIQGQNNKCGFFHAPGLYYDSSSWFSWLRCWVSIPAAYGKVCRFNFLIELLLNFATLLDISHQLLKILETTPTFLILILVFQMRNMTGVIQIRSFPISEFLIIII